MFFLKEYKVARRALLVLARRGDGKYKKRVKKKSAVLVDGGTMERSWLIQRLQKPHPKTILGADNPFAFGGGLRNGGLSDTAMSLLRSVFSFDYMGAAEFEWGAVPQALNKIAKNIKDYNVSQVDIDSKPVFIICRTADREEIERRIIDWGTQPYHHLKEQVHLYNTLNPKTEWDGRSCGWLELDNSFFFFTDQQMFLDTAKLFGFEVVK